MTDDELGGELASLAPDVEIEQEVALLQRVALLAGAFYTALLGEGLPGALAGRLLEQWHGAQLAPPALIEMGGDDGHEAA
jgi:hypothetical protein